VHFVPGVTTPTEVGVVDWIAAGGMLMETVGGVVLGSCAGVGAGAGSTTGVLIGDDVAWTGTTVTVVDVVGSVEVVVSSASDPLSTSANTPPTTAGVVAGRLRTGVLDSVTVLLGAAYVTEGSAVVAAELPEDEPVRLAIVLGSHELGPENHPVRRLAISEA